MRAVKRRICSSTAELHRHCECFIWLLMFSM